MRLFLASSSPRRMLILSGEGLDLSVIEPDTCEVHSGNAADIVVENARKKALSVKTPDDAIIIGCDTVGVCNGEVLGKPEGIDDARRMLMLQQDHPCTVISGLAVHDVGRKRTIHGHEISVVEMNGGKEGVEKYLASGQWMGKAGAFGIQDRGPIGAVVVFGKEDNVMGMPVTLLRRLLSLVGYEYPERTPA